MNITKISSFAAIACSLAVCSCSDGGSNAGSTVVDVAGATAAPETLKVTDLGSKITYVPLETTDSSLIPERWKIVPAKDNILVVNYSPWGIGKQNCLSFDKEGKFMAIIGQTGNDPEAYSTPFPLVSENGQSLYFGRNGVEKYLQHYSINGEYKGKALCAMPPLGTPTMSLIVDTMIVSVGCQLDNFTKEMWVSIYSGGLNSQAVDTVVITPKPEGYDASLSFDNVTVRNFNGVLPHSVASFGELTEMGGERKHLFNTAATTPRLQRVGNELHFKEPFIDTMYVVTRNSFTPLFTFNCGENALVPSDINTKGVGSDNLFVTDICENNDFIVFGASKGWLGDENHTGYVGYFDKNSGKTRATTVDKGFEDDLTGFMPFYPIAASESGDLIGIITMEDIDKWMEEHPDAELPEALQNLAEDANPICVIVSK